MRKAFGYLVLITCITIYVVSWSPDLTKQFSAYKLSHTGIFSSNRYRYGDLYGMSNLPYFRKHYRQDDTIKYSNCNSKKKIDLYAVCDSYVWTLLTSNKFYCGVNKLTYIKTNDKEVLRSDLDTSKINILLLEFSERNVRYLLDDTGYANALISKNRNDNNSIPVNQQGSSFTSGGSARTAIFNFIFNKNINNNLQYNVWDFSFLTPVRELKSEIDYKLFGKVDKHVRMAACGRQLYFTPTIDTNDIMSSFKYLSEQKKDKLINRLNTIYENARQYGFNKIYLSIIPNPVSILEPHYDGLDYNELVKRIQNDPQLKMPNIDVTTEFERLKSKIYLASDSHWSAFGTTIWLNKLNAELEKIAIGH